MKRLFGLIKSKEEKEQIQKDKQEEKDKKEFIDSLPLCEQCQNPILPDERVCKFFKKTMHIGCKRDLIKLVRSSM